MRMGSAGVALDASPASSVTITASTRTLLRLDIVGLPGVAATVPWPTGVDKPGDAADRSAHVASLVLGDRAGRSRRVVGRMARAAAEDYAAIYGFSMLKIPDRSLFPGTGPDGNGMPVAYKTQEQWLNAVQLNGCGNCHQLGDKATREMPAALDVAKASSVEAWTRRLQSGPGGGSMVRFIGLMNTNDGGHLRRLAEWTDRIRAGELPASAPPRPPGVE